MLSDNNCKETDEAEITAGMISKRVRAGESRAEAQSVKWTAEGAVKGVIRVFCDVRDTLVPADMTVSGKVHVQT